MALSSIVKKDVIACLYGTPYELENVSLGIPKVADHGDFSLNMAFKLAKSLKQPPQRIAESICKHLSNSQLFSATVAGGYVNLTMHDHALQSFFYSFLDTPPQKSSNDRILLEYVSANPTGPLHIGHGRWAVIGDGLYRLLSALGVTVDREFYVNDAGNQMARFNDSVSAAKAHQPVPENGYGGYFIDYLIENMTSDESNIDYVLRYQKNTLSKLNCSFDAWFKESTLHETPILDIIQAHFSDYIYEKEDAIWFKTTAFNDDKDRVIQKATGELTYFAADIVYHLNKIERGYNHLINIWGADHHGYVERIRSILQAKSSQVTFQVILGQLVHLYKDGEPVKMSKRTGDLIELDEVVNDIGVDATRYFLSEKKPELRLDFDLALAKEKSMLNPVYYIQYAHARICTIERKVAEISVPKVSRELNKKDRQLMMAGARYYDLLTDAAESFDLYKLPHFLYDFCKIFHSFYKENHIIYDQTIHQERLALIQVTKKIISHCLEILGISSPEKM
ncbi:MAG: arginine--tRNA ligase [Candidatus Marinamargulisbacteria bacterium]